MAFPRTKGLFSFPLILSSSSSNPISYTETQIFLYQHLFTNTKNTTIMDAFTNKTSQQPAAGGAPAGQKDDYVDKGKPSLSLPIRYGTKPYCPLLCPSLTKN